jgi:hypothetical protein
MTPRPVVVAYALHCQLAEQGRLQHLERGGAREDGGPCLHSQDHSEVADEPFPDIVLEKVVRERMREMLSYTDIIIPDLIV